MCENDLTTIERWLRLPHVSRWWQLHDRPTAEFGAIRARVCDEADTATHMVTVIEGKRPIGWAESQRNWSGAWNRLDCRPRQPSP